MSESLENMRLLLELALNSGKKRKSQQTGYLHHCYHNPDNEPHLPIPLVENFLFALALLRSRTVENIQEAKTLIEGLLYFQNHSEDLQSKGNFPIYLHDFPNCKDRFVGIQVGNVIYWILKHFHQVIGQDLKKRLEKSLFSTVQHALHLYTEKSASYPISVKIAAIAAATGRLLGNQQMADYGQQMLDVLKDNPDETCWFCPGALGSILASLLTVYPNLKESPWKAFWNHLETTWHRGTGCYAGPSLKEWQQGLEPQVTLYDLACSYFSDVFSDRVTKESSIHLEAVLIPISEERFTPSNYPLEIRGTLQGTHWTLLQEENLALSTIEKGGFTINPSIEKGFHPFRLIWGNHQRVHSFVCQGGDAKSITIHDDEMLFDIQGPIDVEDREEHREIQFFMDMHEDLEFLVANEKSSTFRLGESISIKDKQLSLTLSFHLEEGEGRFFGHWMLGNRPSQLNNKGASRFNAYDWQLFLRTINRENKCRFKVKFHLDR